MCHYSIGRGQKLHQSPPRLRFPRFCSILGVYQIHNFCIQLHPDTIHDTPPLRYNGVFGELGGVSSRKWYLIKCHSHIPIQLRYISYTILHLFVTVHFLRQNTSMAFWPYAMTCICRCHHLSQCEAVLYLENFLTQSPNFTRTATQPTLQPHWICVTNFFQ